MFDKLKSIFVVEDPKGKNVEENAEEIVGDSSSESQETIVQSVSNSKSAETIQNVSGQPDPKFINVLLKAIEASNLEGFDYLEFKQSLQSLAKMDMDEQTKYMSAFAMAKTMGATLPKLTQSASHYLNILKEEESKFNEALKNQESRQIHERRTSIADLGKMIDQKQKEIAKLTQDIEKHKEMLNQQNAEIDQAAAKVQNTKLGFMGAYQQLAQQIQGDVDKMKMYLK